MNQRSDRSRRYQHPIAIACAAALAACPGSIDDISAFVEIGKGSECEVAKLLVQRCATAGCHEAGDKAAQGLDLASPGVEQRLVGVNSTQARCSDLPLVDPTAPEGSFFIQKLEEKNPECGFLMPQVGQQLPAAELDCVKQWVVKIATEPVAPSSDGGGGTQDGGGGSQDGSTAD